MKIPSMVMAEFRRLTSRGLARLALAALMVVPILYGGLYLWANQDPYSRLDQVPVALVVADTGAVVDGEDTRYGDEVADNLIEDASFDWRRMDAGAAESALRRGEVDFSVTIPEDFSEALASAAGDQPHQATLLLATNDANNYLASTIGEQAVEKIRASVAEMVGEEAALQLLDGIAEARDGFASAADGVAELADGSDSAADGATELADGTVRLRSGTADLADGARRLASGSAQVATGADGLASGTAQVAGGAAQVASGAGELASGAAGLADGAAALQTGTAELAAGTTALDAAATEAAAQSQAAVDALPVVTAGIAADLATKGFTPEQIEIVLGELAPFAETLSGANASLQAAVPQIAALDAGAQRVAAGAAELASGAEGLSAGASSLADGAVGLSAGASQLAGGASQVSAGAAQVASGASSAASGASTLHQGTVSLSEGALALDDGLSQLASGAGTLHEGLAEAVTKMPDSDVALRGDQAKTIADPVSVSADSVAAAGAYGAGLAPFFAALAGWIGIYALFLIVKPVSRRAVTALHSPVRITIAGWLTPAVLGAVQMIVLFGVLALALGFSFANPLATLGIMVLASLVYASIILALNVWLGSVGQFLGLVLMVLQLVTAGGTFPWQTLPAPLAALHQVLPMGYVVDGMRQLMYGGDLGRITGDVTVLVAWLLGGLVVAAFGVVRLTHRTTLRDLAPSIMV